MRKKKIGIAYIDPWCFNRIAKEFKEHDVVMIDTAMLPFEEKIVVKLVKKGE